MKHAKGQRAARHHGEKRKLGQFMRQGCAIIQGLDNACFCLTCDGWDYPYSLGTVNFFHPDYEYINNCAYFDYQRKKVYARTSNALKKKKSGKKKLPNKKLRVSNHVMVKASSCPTCKSRKIIGGVKREKWSKGSNVKRAFDLVLTLGGIRRKVIEVRASIHQCLNCDKKFIPPAYQRLDKHFHSLKSWAMFQHVEYSISFEAISRMFEEFFSLRVLTSEIHEFKSFLARYYKTTYKKLLRKILTGNMLHIDETEMKLRKEKGYVWVFTNLEEVVFMFKPTREGGFLRDLLKGFQGVLVSDFYTTYDSVECPQQKCLIHLMRDINQELLSNPFDEELQLITRPFGTLLRTIITTIDKHGLRHKYLRKHEREVTDFFQSLSEHSFDSEAAKTLQERITKYRNKLFTFINYDGVPWNNNNAEHAIKQFANYRERTTGKMTENGLSDYLVLLSICQTCHYKDVSFLKFLLSRQQDIDAFCERKHQKLRLPAIELYPKGFVPPRMINLHNRRLQREQQRDGALPQDILGVEAGR